MVYRRVAFVAAGSLLIERGLENRKTPEGGVLNVGKHTGKTKTKMINSTGKSLPINIAKAFAKWISVFYSKKKPAARAGLFSGLSCFFLLHLSDHSIIVQALSRLFFPISRFAIPAA